MAGYKDKWIKREALTKGMRLRIGADYRGGGGELREITEVSYSADTDVYTVRLEGGGTRTFHEGEAPRIGGKVPASVRCKIMERFGRAGSHLYSYSPTGRDRDARHVFENPDKEKAFGSGWFTNEFLRKRTDFYMTGVLR